MGQAADAGGSDGTDADSSPEHWLQEIIDTFAVEYRWSKHQTLEELYPEEIPLLMERIARRRRNEALQRVMDWQVALKIALAPHTKEFGRDVRSELDRMAREIKGDPTTTDAEEELRARVTALNRRRFGDKEAG